MDDVIVSRDQKHWLVVCNASNREKLIKHFHEVRHETGMDFDMADQTEGTVMVAIQGPKVIERLAGLLPEEINLKEMKRYHFVTDSFMLIKFTVFRSGYTGEDGVEMILPAKVASMAMKLLGGKFEKEGATIQPAGLGARDTLRLEAGMPLYGHELTESIDPISRRPGLGGRSDEGFHRRRRAARDRREQGRRENSSAWNSKASASRGKARRCETASRSSAKSPAARSARPCRSRSRWRTSMRTSRPKERNWRSI